MKKINRYFLYFTVLLLLLTPLSICSSSSSTAVGTGCSGDNCVQLANPLGDINNIPAFLGVVIKAVLGIVGSLALAMFIYGGITWMTAMGNTDKITRGRGILTWAVIGLVVIFTAYAVVLFLLKSLNVS